MTAKQALAILSGCILAGGCLVRETTHTLYLEPDGSVIWSVVERDVRSDEADPAKRADEERAFLEDARAGEHPTARALARLGGAEIETRILRARRPFAVITEARFDDVERLAGEFFERLGVPHAVELRREGPLARLRITLGPADDAARDEDGEVLPLLEEAARYRIVLTQGKFVEAEGFEIEQDGTVAVPLEQDPAELEAHGQGVVLSLAWSAEP